jgi:hypothetical protein
VLEPWRPPWPAARVPNEQPRLGRAMAWFPHVSDCGPGTFSSMWGTGAGPGYGSCMSARDSSFEVLGYKIKRGKQLGLPLGKIRGGAQSGRCMLFPARNRSDDSWIRYARLPADVSLFDIPVNPWWRATTGHSAGCRLARRSETACERSRRLESRSPWSSPPFRRRRW